MTGTLYSAPEGHGYLRAERDDPYQMSILARVTAYFGLMPGDRVLEVGAGVGRYSRQLRRLGLAVLATEPDPVLFEELAANAAADADIETVRAAVGELPALEEGLAAVCGFHVLHHLRRPELEALGREIVAFERWPGFKGWFFVEPNPLNPLYPLQIAITPGMRFHEEQGIWRNDYNAAFAVAGVSCRVIGSVGILPPQVSSRLPRRLAVGLAPRFGRGLGPLSLYRVFGGLSGEPSSA